ncbi:MAG: diphthamide biosynthesis enzyme Dph2 [Candidatus Anstonellales archaeon]
MRILIQFPEGLKKYAIEFAEKLEQEGNEVYISASPCYGACDLAIDEARALKVDKIIHVGHNKFIKKDIDIEVEYIPFSIDFPLDIVERETKKLVNIGIKSIALLTTVQHIHQIERMKDIIEKNGIKVYLKKGYWATMPGQVLGCDAIAANINEADAVLFIGDGLFHPLAVNNGKRVFALNIGGLNEITHIIKNLEKRRKANIIAAYNAKSFGILVSTKIGQYNIGQAKWAQEQIKKFNKKAAILVANELNPSSLYNFMSFDCYVNTACPRIVDDTEAYGKPIINMEMLKIVIDLWNQKAANL